MNRTQSLSTFFYSRAENFVSDALQTYDKDTNITFKLYQNAMINFIHAYKEEKKEIYRNIYKERVSSVFSDIQKFEKRHQLPISKLEDFYEMANEKRTMANINEYLPNENPRLSMYPDLSLLGDSQTLDSPQSVRNETGDKRKRHHSKRHHLKPALNISEKIVKISDYKKGDKIGSGSFGSVYFATERATGNIYALKELGAIDTPESQVSFLREVEALAQANHHAVLSLKGFCLLISKQEPFPAIITDYLPGGSVQDIIDRKKDVSNTNKYIILYGVAEAMRYIHDKLKIVHRDLKPANVMLTDNLEPVVGDFGLAKIMSHEFLRQTQASGSPVYMAPELLNSKEYSNKVDVYSYGVLCYELLSEKYAFQEVKSLPDLINKVVSGKRPSLNISTIPESFKELIEKCWSSSIEERPSFKEISRKFKKHQLLIPELDMNEFENYKSKLS